MAYHDYLTNLPNRLLFSEILDHAISLYKQTAGILAVMFLDLDGFKIINDTLCHHYGDQLLEAVARRLSDQLGDPDTIARIGGDEFIIMIENIEEIDAVNIIAEKILRCFDNLFLLGKQECYLSTSIGIAVYPTDGEDTGTLLKNADIAMYRAKEKGKNQFVLCSQLMKMNVLQNMNLSNHLYHAVDRDELGLYYQPQVNSGFNRIIGLEALLRWNHPDKGMISPALFIPVAEQTGLIVSIGDWVLRTACRQFREWQQAGLAPQRIAVNVSVQQIHTPNFARKVENILAETGLDPRHLEVEITESTIMKEPHAVIKTLSALKEMGIKLAIDDFGTEYSSLNYIKELPVDRIKIAMPFIHGIDVSHKDEAIVKAIIVLAKNLDLDVIAEGVESDNQLNFLSQRLCDQIQGFYFYQPMPADQIEALLKSLSGTI